MKPTTARMNQLTIQCFQHVPYETAGNIEDWCNENGHQFRYTRLFLGEKPPKTSDFDCLVVMGGPMSVHDTIKFPWLKDEKQAIENAIQSGKKVLGICLGAQLIAHALGAEVFTNNEKEIGWYNITFSKTARQLFSLALNDTSMNVFHWHGETFSLPDRALLLASSAACTNQAYIIDDQVLAFQFHPEIKPENIKLMVQYGKEELVSGNFIQAIATISGEQKYFDQAKLFLYQTLDRFLTSDS